MLDQGIWKAETKIRRSKLQSREQSSQLRFSWPFFLFYPAKAAQSPDLCMRDGDRRTDIVACPLMENPHRITATFELEFWTPYPLPGTELHNLYSFCLLLGYPHPTTVVVTYGVGTSLQSQPSSRQSSHHHPFYEGASLLPPLSSFFWSILCFLSPLHHLALNALRTPFILNLLNALPSWD